MSKRKPRGLRPDEEALWEKVRQTAVPMHTSNRQTIKQAVEQPNPRKPGSRPIERFAIGQSAMSPALAHNVAPAIEDQVAAEPVRMDRKNFGKMKRGKLLPEARLDLHGMTLAEAHPRLNRFILDSHAQGRRLVLVITGKGRDKPDAGPIPVRRGVLRHQVPAWLKSGPIGSAVLQVTEAHVRHGGGGAYYVYLRRRG